jgi:phosphopantetheinyl transferase
MSSIVMRRAASIRHRIFDVTPNLPHLEWPALQLPAGTSLALLVPAGPTLHEQPGAARSAAVRALVRRLLGQLTRTAPGALRIANTQRGKPCLEGADSIRFSVSHARAYSLVALSRLGDIGCDIEDRFDADDVDRLGPLVLHPQELETVNRWRGPEREDAFRRCWVRKEAVLKAAGSGFLEDPRSLVAADDGWRLHDLQVDARCAAAVAGTDAECAWHLLAAPGIG